MLRVWVKIQQKVPQTENPSQTINQELCKVMDWLNVNKLSLNQKKSHFIVFGKLSTNTSLKLTMNDKNIEQTKSTKFLGYIIEENMSWRMHVECLCNKLSKSIGMLRNAIWKPYISAL